MIKPTTPLVIVATLVSSSSWAATRPATTHVAHPLLAPSSRVRRRAAADGVTPHERKLPLQSAASCFMTGGAGPNTAVPCGEVSCSTSATTCVADEGTALREGSNLCDAKGAFEIVNPNQTDCVWQYACCTCCTPTYDDTS